MGTVPSRSFGAKELRAVCWENVPSVPGFQKVLTNLRVSHSPACPVFLRTPPFAFLEGLATRPFPQKPAAQKRACKDDARADDLERYDYSRQPAHVWFHPQVSDVHVTDE